MNLDEKNFRPDRCNAVNSMLFRIGDGQTDVVAEIAIRFRIETAVSRTINRHPPLGMEVNPPGSNQPVVAGRLAHHDPDRSFLRPGSRHVNQFIIDLFVNSPADVDRVSRFDGNPIDATKSGPSVCPT